MVQMFQPVRSLQHQILILGRPASPLPLTVEAETQSRTLPCWSVASEHDRWHVSRKGKGRSVTGKNKRKSRLKGANKPQYHALSGYGRQGSPQGINRTVLRAKEFAVLLPQNLVVEASVPLGARLCDSRFLAHLLAIDGAFTIIGEVDRCCREFNSQIGHRLSYAERRWQLGTWALFDRSQFSWHSS